MSADLVTLHDLSVRLGGKPILKGINAALAAGQITALIGLNGSGKTTLLRAILKEVPYTGRVEFHCGHDHTHPMPQQVGYVPQKLRVEANFPLTVCDFLALALQRRPLFLGVSRRALATMKEMLRRVGADPDLYLDLFVDKLSGGQLQRVLLALALHPHPELLLLDEPAAGIDFQMQEEIYELLARVNRETGVTVLLVSHELSVVSRHAHHVLCMTDGQIECQGPPHQVMTGEMLFKIFGKEQGLYAHDHGLTPAERHRS